VPTYRTIALSLINLTLVLFLLTGMMSFEMACELQNPLFLFRYSVLDSFEVVLATSGLLLLPFPVLLALLREGRESKASPVK
jgi:hypothetical protein